MKKILLVGNGAREHIIAEKMMASGEVELYVVGKARNPALMEMAKEYVVGDICSQEFVRDFAEKMGVDFAVMGPEAPIEAGIVDALREAGVPSASPLQTVGRLETSKSFTRDLLEKYQIPGNPQFKVFTSEEGVREFMEELGGDYVVKADGLKGGKGVKVSGDHLETIDEGFQFASECIAEAGRVVVEEKFVGQEFSLMSFCDGKNIASMPAIQDHKRAYENDQGPNTGGMGSYSDERGLLPFMQPGDIAEAEEITRKVAAALLAETGEEFKGVMYGGFIITKSGVRLIEYNARFGDPEVMNALSVIETDLVEVFEAMIEGRLDQVEMRFAAKATVCKYVVPEGYPDQPVKGEKIEVGELPEGAQRYYASIDAREDGLYLSGSRAIAFVGVADTLEEAERVAETAVSSVKGPVFHRKDVGTAELIGKRVAMMKDIRG